MKRPGFLGDYHKTLIPRKLRISTKPRARTLGEFGYFGKGSIAPPPGATGSGSQIITEAVNAATGQYYEQDVRCPVGEKMTMTNNPCAGAECCDGGDCDAEGTVYSEEECADDPNYRDLPDDPAGGYTSCSQYQAAGIPGPCDQNTCPSCFQPPPQQQQQQQQQSAPAPQAASAPEAASAPQAASGGDDAAMQAAQAELLQLEAAAQAVAATPGAATYAASSYTAPQYTGGGQIPVARRRQAKAPSDEQKILELVEAHETQRALQRSNSPTSSMMAPRPMAPISRPQPAADEGSIFSWLRGALFGGYNATGLGNWTTQPSYVYLIPVVLGVAYLLKTRMPAKAKKNKKRKR